MVEQRFSVKDVARIFGLKESRLRYWAQTGFINPSARDGSRQSYTFGDLVEVRAARDLLDKGISLQRVRRNLQALRDGLPEEAQPLNRIRVRSDGDTLVVSDGSATLDALTGQVLIDFSVGEINDEAAQILSLGERAANCPPANRQSGRISESSPDLLSDTQPSTAYDWFLRGCRLDEDLDRADDAEAAYQQALELDPGLAAAHTNLGNLYYRQMKRDRAIGCYETACALDPDQAEARYNLGNIYEEEGDLELAIAEYRHALRSVPDFRDAHFNLALTLERVGGRVQAIEHWKRFLQLCGEDDIEPEWSEMAREHLTHLERA
ncbi:MAG: tetratricopeptide repeat protein [Deltaproteobacteria bacterium]|nr:tetratricopeptide repeat protein [Deltaproteobacteria bacterium]